VVVAVARLVSSPESAASNGAADLPEPQRDGARPTVDLLADAYEQRTEHLHDARTALAEAVSALRTELEQRRREVAALGAERDQARLDHGAEQQRSENLARETQELRARIAVLEAELRDARELVTAVRHLKVVRWSAWPRRWVYGWRARRG
jgi:predicted RNase H-like nuclease (RuvC/YqgF family)